jgi:hypothetical protein
VKHLRSTFQSAFLKISNGIVPAADWSEEQEERREDHRLSHDLQFFPINPGVGEGKAIDETTSP